MNETTTGRTLITGATGLVGRHLVPRATNAVILTRDPSRAQSALGTVDAHHWDPLAGPPPPQALHDVDVVINLAGEPVSSGRWTEEKKRSIRDSRVVGTRNLVAGLARLEHKPSVLLSASAVGFYGDRGDHELDERLPAGDGFLAEVCQDWEREAMVAEQLGIRVICVRIGVVLASGGGALARMLTPFKLGVGGPLGSGSQWMPWIHIDDLVGLMLHVIDDAQVGGPVNAVAPNPVTSAQLSKQLGRVLRRPAFIPVPAFALRLAFGRMSEILTASQRVVPRVAQRSGYVFEHPELAGALDSLLGRSTPDPIEAANANA